MQADYGTRTNKALHTLSSVASGNTYTNIFKGATFLPIDNPSRSELLLEEVWRFRQATLLALGLKISHLESELYRISFSNSIQRFLACSPQLRRAITEYPPLRIWLRQCIQAEAHSSTHMESGKDTLIFKLADFERILNSFFEKRSNTNTLVIPGTSIFIERFDVDPLIVEVSPPSYQFPDEKRQREIEETTAYSLSFFLEVATAATERIKQTWLAAYQDFTKFVRIIIHVPNANFRSCSADRYAGVIFLSADDDTLLDVEESFIHEYGHQILYNVIELDPLIYQQEERRFNLPWSGAERDFWGYFHAFFIYILLLCYFERINNRAEDEQQRATQRLLEILRGAIQAVPDLEGANCFTPKGEELFRLLKAQVDRFEKQYQRLL